MSLVVSIVVEGDCERRAERAGARSLGAVIRVASVKMVYEPDSDLTGVS